MSQQQKLTIGLFGFGTVGEGIYKVLQSDRALNATIKKICIHRQDIDRNAPAELFTTNREEILEDSEINLVIELIDDADEALIIVTGALRRRKAVISANKKMIAENLATLLTLQQEHDVPFLYEAAVCGSVPVVRSLESYYDVDQLKSLHGIINGSTNFILTRILEKGDTFQHALREAQRLGFAESNPQLDISGGDAVNKLVILLLHAYGIITHPHRILQRGIDTISVNDALLAHEKGYKIKLIARAHKLDNDKIVAYVLPQFLHCNNLLSPVINEYNALVIESTLAQKQFLSGKGAGRYPTSSAVLSDIAAVANGYHYRYAKKNSGLQLSLTDDAYLRIYVSFENWNQVNKWDFGIVEACHSSGNRQYLIGVIHVEKLKDVAWFRDSGVSIIAMPDCVVEKSEVVQRNIRKISLQLAGVG